MPKPYGRERGQAILEFAVIFPIFAFFLFLAIDGALVMGRYGETNHAAKEAARVAATGAGRPAIVARVFTTDPGCNESADRSVCIYYADGPPPNSQSAGEVGSLVKVTVRYKRNLVTPLMGGSFLGVVTNIPDGFVINACASNRLEHPVTGAGGGGSGACS